MWRLPFRPFVALTVVCCLLGTAPAKSTPVVDSNSEIGFAISALSLNYQEFDKGTILDTNGYGRWPIGASLKLSTLSEIGNGQLFLRLDFHGISGAATQADPSQRPVLSYKGGISVNNLQLDAGAPILTTAGFILIPFIGAEYREWLRTIPRAAVFTRENYTFAALGAGSRLSTQITDRVVFSTNLSVEDEIHPQLSGSNYSCGSAYVTKSLSSRPVWHLQPELDYKLSGVVHAFWGVDLASFGFRQSAASNWLTATCTMKGIYEPRSSTSQAIVSAGIAWGF